MSSVLGKNGLSVPLMMLERDLLILTHTVCLSELGESSVDNCSKRRSFRFALLLNGASSDY